MILSQIYIDNVTTYWILRLIMLALLVFSGVCVTYKNRDNKYFWYYAMPVILFYIFSEGLRFERGDDYKQYATELAGLWHSEGLREPVYQGFVYFVNFLKIPYWVCFMFYSGLIICSFMSVMKHFPKYAVWAFPVFFLLTDYPAESMIRQYIAIPFICYAYAAYLSGKTVRMYVMLALVPLIHFSGLIAVGSFLLFYFFDPIKWIKSPLILVGIYLLFVAFFEVSYFDNFSDYIQNNDIEMDAHQNMSNYVENSDRWLTDEGNLIYITKGGEAGGKTKFNIMTGIVFDCLMIFLGFLGVRKNRKLAIPYCFSYIGIVLLAIGGEIELYNRFAWWFIYFLPVIVGSALTDVKMNLWLWLVVLGFVLVQYVYPLLFKIGEPGYAGCAFVWDIIQGY